MADSLFQLGASTLFSPLALAQAVQDVAVSEFSPVAQELTLLAEGAEMDKGDLGIFRKTSADLDTAIDEGDTPKAKILQKRLARLVAGHGADEKFSEAIRKTDWRHSLFHSKTEKDVSEIKEDAPTIVFPPASSNKAPEICFDRRGKDTDSKEFAALLQNLGEEFDATAEAYFLSGSPLDEHVYGAYREECQSRSPAEVLKTFDRLREELAAGSWVTLDRRTPFAEALSRYCLEQVGETDFLHKLAFAGLDSYRADLGNLHHWLDFARSSGYAALCRLGEGWSVRTALRLFSTYQKLGSDVLSDIFNRALKRGYYFEEALFHIGKSEDPFQTSRKIEEAKYRFAHEEVDIQTMERWSEIEKLGFYAHAEEMFFEAKGNYSPYPSYTRFFHNIEQALFFSDIRTAADILDPNSRFNFLATAWTYPVRPETHLYGSPKMNIYDLLQQLDDKPGDIKISSLIFQRVHDGFSNRPRHVREAFTLNVRIATSCEQLEASVLLLEEGIEFTALTEKLLAMEDPLGAVQSYLEKLREAEKKSSALLSSTPSDIDMMVLATILYRHFGLGISEEHTEACMVMDRMRTVYDHVQDDIRILLHLFPNGESVSINFSEVAKRIKRQMAYCSYSSNRWDIDENWEVDTDPSAPLFSRSHKRYDNPTTPKEAAPYGILKLLMSGQLDVAGNLQRIWQRIFNAPFEVVFEFYLNVNNAETPDELVAAMELFELDIPLGGKYFQRYVRVPDQVRRKENISNRMAELAVGAALISLEDPIEIGAVTKLIGIPETDLNLDFLPAQELIVNILNQAKIVPMDSAADPAVFTSHEPMTAVKQSFFLHERFNQELLEDIVRQIRADSDPVAVVKHLLYFFEDGMVPQKETLSFFQIERTEALPQVIAKLDSKQAMEFLKYILLVMVQKGHWIQQTLKKILTCLTWHESFSSEDQQTLNEFHIQLSPEKLIEALKVASKFFERSFPMTLEKHRDAMLPYTEPDSKKRERLYLEMNKMKLVSRDLKKLSMLADRLARFNLESVEVTLYPSRTPLDAFYGYVAQNCLANPEYAIYGMADTGFIPLRILVTEEGRQRWIGTIMTFARMIDGQKILIVSGIDPQISFNPEKFLESLEDYFTTVAKKGSYDLILLPAHAGMQSSRRAFLSRTVRERYTRQYKIEGGVGFPRKALGDTREAFYGIHTDFLVMVDNR